MSNVTLMIGGRSYAVACATGEEAHIEALGRSIDARIAGQANLTGQSEARTLLFASLLLADELHELRLASKERATFGDELAETLESVANTLENLAGQLER